jgi:hypothetical protein
MNHSGSFRGVGQSYLFKVVMLYLLPNAVEIFDGIFLFLAFFDERE